MYPRQKFIESFGLLGDFLGQFSQGKRRDEGPLAPINAQHYDSMAGIIDREHILNPWFTPQWVGEALDGISLMLDRKGLATWLESYREEESGKAQNVGLVMAGNIPLVGFHDLMCVLAAGHRVLAKASSKDERLIREVASVLQSIQPELGERIHFTEDRLQGMDAMIATGSNNSARHFEYYFRNIPHIIRKNRNGVAVLSGKESKKELALLGKDIFTFFGMGCRNVSKLYIPEDYHLPDLLNVLDDYNWLSQHHKYANNVDYHRSLYLMNLQPFLDNGVLLLREDKSIASPVGVAFYERYSEIDAVVHDLKTRRMEIQCVVSILPSVPACIPPGTSQ